MRQQTFLACLSLIETEGWKEFSFAKAATISDIPLAGFYEHFSSPLEILVELFRQIDMKVLKTVDIFEDALPRDRLFEIFMRRFEVAQPYKAILKDFWNEWHYFPGELSSVACQGFSSMGWMMEAVGMSQQGLPGTLRIHGLTILYFLTLKTWLSDDSPDLGKTMAFLDKSLSQFEGVAAFLNSL